MENIPQEPSNVIERVTPKKKVYTHDYSLNFCITSNKENPEEITEAEVMAGLKARVSSIIYAEVWNYVEHYNSCDDLGNYLGEDNG